MDDDTRGSVANAFTSAAISATAGDLVSTAATVSGLLVGIGMQVDAKRRAQAEQVLAEAAEEIGSRERLAFLANGDPARLELLARIVEASARTTMADKIHALARALAQGLQGDTVDEALIVAGALADLEAPHMGLLLAIARPPQGAGHLRRIGWTEYDVAQHVPGSAAVARSLISTLERHALIERGGGTQGPNPRASGWKATLDGLHMLDLLGAQVWEYRTVRPTTGDGAEGQPYRC
jgi:hypothetical protein